MKHNETLISAEAITVDHTDNKSGVRDLISAYNVDTGPLAMPSHIRIGQQGTNCGGGHDYTIRSYGDQVDEYGIWLSQQIKTENQEVMEALDHIFNKALNGSIVITTRCCPAPWITHAHVVRRQILELAGHKFEI